MSRVRASGNRGTPVTRSLQGLAVAGAAALVWGTLIERRLFTLRRVTVPVLEPGAQPLRVLHISDLHMAPWQSHKQRWVRGLAALKPDLVVNTGDNCGHEHALIGLKHALEPFRGTPGVFVHGSNDYYGPRFKNPLKYLLSPSQAPSVQPTLDIDALTGFFEDDLGWVSLNNAATQFKLAGNELEFFGLNDPHINYDRAELMHASITDARTTPQAHPTRIGVVHAPYTHALDTLVAAGAAAVIAGHTHGGQVCIPGFGAVVTNCDLPRDQAKGLSTWHHERSAAFLNVSAGLGNGIYAPIRFACRPEASLLTLVPRSSN